MPDNVLRQDHSSLPPEGVFCRRRGRLAFPAGLRASGPAGDVARDRAARPRGAGPTECVFVLFLARGGGVHWRLPIVTVLGRVCG